MRELEREEKEVGSKIDNLVNAIANGIITDSTKSALEKLEKRKEEIVGGMIRLKEVINMPVEFEQCREFLASLTRIDKDDFNNRLLLINRFIKQIHIADDQIKILFYPLDERNMKGEKIYKIEPEDGLNSPINEPETSRSLTQISSPPNKYYGQLDDLLEWNKLDPVDYFEIHRNNLCYNAIQKNRNPFIDYPEWADICFGNTDTGIEIGIDTGANGSLSGNYYGNTVYANVPLNTSDFELIFTDSLGNKNKLSFDDVTYKITYLNNVYDIDLKNKGFDKVGKYELTFYYESGDHKFNSKTITINVKNPYTIKIDSSTSQKTCYNVNEELDLSKLVIYKYKNGKQDGVVEDYTVEILDSEGNLLSTDKNYKFTKSGSYKVNVNYEVNGETLTTSYEVTADYTTSQLIIYGIVALVVIILLIIGYILYNKYFKKKKKSNGRKKSSTKCSSKSKKTTKK